MVHQEHARTNPCRCHPVSLLQKYKNMPLLTLHRYLSQLTATWGQINFRKKTSYVCIQKTAMALQGPLYCSASAWQRQPHPKLSKIFKAFWAPVASIVPKKHCFPFLSYRINMGKKSAGHIFGRASLLRNFVPTATLLQRAFPLQGPCLHKKHGKTLWKKCKCIRMNLCTLLLAIKRHHLKGTQNADS